MYTDARPGRTPRTAVLLGAIYFPTGTPADAFYTSGPDTGTTLGNPNAKPVAVPAARPWSIRPTCPT